LAAAHDTPMSGRRHRQLQEHRKQKATAFLTMVKQSDVGQTAGEDVAAESASNAGTKYVVV